MEEGEEYQDDDAAIQQIFLENQELKNRNAQLGQAATLNAGFNDQEEQNLINYQLETDRIMERIEHYLKGSQLKFNDKGSYFGEPTKNILVSVKEDPKTNFKYFIEEQKEQKKGTEVIRDVLVKIANVDTDEEGNKFYDEVDIMELDSKKILDKINKKELKNLGYKYVNILDESKKPLNEYGVAEFMRIISMYVTKETFLSFYTEERINEIMGDLGDELNKFLYCNYEKMGMDTKFKESKYTIMVLNILHVIESCYRRALYGAEQRNIQTRAIVTQNQGMGSGGSRPVSMKKKWNPLKPSTW